MTRTEAEPVQAELDALARKFVLAHTQRARGRLVGLGGAALCGLLVLAGLILIFVPIEGWTAFLNVLFAGAGLGFAGCIHLAVREPAALQEATLQILALGPRLTGEEELEAPDSLRADLHELLKRPDLHLRSAVLKLLALCGDRESLSYVRAIAGYPDRKGPFLPAEDAAVRRIAERAAHRIQARLEAARLAQTLLRPSATGTAAELLRPAERSGVADSGRLLRPADEDGTDGA